MTKAQGCQKYQWKGQRAMRVVRTKQGSSEQQRPARTFGLGQGRKWISILVLGYLKVIKPKRGRSPAHCRWAKWTVTERTAEVGSEVESFGIVSWPGVWCSKLLIEWLSDDPILGVNMAQSLSWSTIHLVHWTKFQGRCTWSRHFASK